MREITSQIEVLRNEAEVFYNNKDFDAAEKKLAEIEDLNKEYAIAEKLFKEDKTKVDDKLIVQSKEEKKIFC